MNGLDLFSGIGGISIALEPWVRTVAYCERDRYAQSVLLSRMWSGDIDRAPIWDDITTLKGSMLPRVDIIFGGFPCQDISGARHDGRGLDGERSGLFFEIMRLADEIRPQFIFLENVPAITSRGLSRVTAEISELGYDCRWTIVSAAEVGAPHLRKRWFLLAANADRELMRIKSGRGRRQSRQDSLFIINNGEQESLAREVCNTASEGLSHGADETLHQSETLKKFERPNWWQAEPSVCRVVNELPSRVDRLKCLGNSVVPIQAREAFKRLAGIE